MVDSICIFEDDGYSNLLPLVFTKPTYDLLSGILTLREKIIFRFPKAPVTLHSRKYLENLLKRDNPEMLVNSFNKNVNSVLFINGRIILDDSLVKLLTECEDNSVFVSKDDVIAAKISGNFLNNLSNNLPETFSIADFQNLKKIEIDATFIKYPWDLVNRNGIEISNDFDFLVDRNSEMISGTIYENVTLINRENIFIDLNAKIKPGVVLDAESGPIYIARDVTIMPNSVIEGPCFIGENSIIKIGAKIYENTSIGKMCKVGGEVEQSIIHSYSNKQHEGFLGHAYLGQWVNLGADTNNSDLKNNYSNVKVILNDGDPIDTHSIFAGLIMGDHSKTAINTMINTGTVVGFSSNIFGSGFPEKYVTSFSWGGSDSLSTYEISKSIEVANKVMERRKMPFSDIDIELFTEIFKLTKNERAKRNM